MDTNWKSASNECNHRSSDCDQVNKQFGKQVFFRKYEVLGELQNGSNWADTKSCATFQCLIKSSWIKMDIMET